MPKVMNQLPTREDDEQFVAHWEYNGRIWCDTLRYTDTGLVVLSDNGNTESPAQLSFYDCPHSGISDMTFVLP